MAPPPVAGTERKPPCNSSTNEELDGENGDHKLMAVHTSLLPYLPDSVIHKFFQLLPAKFSVRLSLVSKKWAHFWSLEVPVLDFDFEDEGNPGCEDDLRRPKLFVKFVERCFERYEHCQRDNVSLDKFRLRIASYNSDFIRATSVDKWLSFAVERSVQAFDISLRPQRKLDDDGRIHEIGCYYCMPSQTLAGAKFLTSLSLEYVRLDDIINRTYDVSWDNGDPLEALEAIEAESLFPCLKTMSLKDVIFKKQSSVFWLISACPSIKSLSLTSCSFSAATSVLNWVIVVPSASLKSLQLMHCKARRVQVVKAINLESVTLVSDISIHEILLMDKCHKLKYINISTQHLKILRLSGIGQRILKATIDTPNLDGICFSGYLKPHVISTKAPKLFMAMVTLFWDAEEPNPSSHSPSTNFLALRDFLANFDCSKEIRLCFGDVASAGVFVCPENFRKTLSPPFPSVKDCILVHTPRSPQIAAISFGLYPSLRSMAPSAKTIRSVKFVESSLPARPIVLRG